MKGRQIILTSAALLSLCWSSPVRADFPTFLTEGAFGLMHGHSDGASTTPGYATGVLLGIGGRPQGSWLRYYFVMEVVGGTYERAHYQNFRDITLDRGIFEFGGGLRVVLPITSQFRWFFDSELMAVVSSTEVVGQFVQDSGSSELDFGLRFGTGFQVRPLDIMSIGARFSTTSVFDTFDSDASRGWLQGFESEGGHFDATLSLSFYF